MKRYNTKATLTSILTSALVAIAVGIGVTVKMQAHSQREDIHNTIENFEPCASSVAVPVPEETYILKATTAEAEEIECEAEPKIPDFEFYEFIPLDVDLQSAIYAACAEHEIAYDLVLAVIKTESEFDTEAIGDNGHAYGLMQIQPRWWDNLATEKGLTDYQTNPAQNTELGTAILDFLLVENGGDLNKALIAYNGGADYPERVYSNYEWIIENEEGLHD